MAPRSFVFDTDQVGFDFDNGSNFSDFYATPTIRDQSHRKMVSFDTTPQVKDVLHVKDYTEDEIMASWYSLHDFALMKAQDNFILRNNNVVMNHHSKRQQQQQQQVQQSADNSCCEEEKISKLCSRGLECRTLEGSRQRKANRMNAQFVVFDEQLRQSEDGIHEPELIAAMYSKECSRCQIAAIMRAKQDSDDVRK